MMQSPINMGSTDHKTRIQYQYIFNYQTKRPVYMKMCLLNKPSCSCHRTEGFSVSSLIVIAVLYYSYSCTRAEDMVQYV